MVWTAVISPTLSISLSHSLSLFTLLLLSTLLFLKRKVHGVERWWDKVESQVVALFGNLLNLCMTFSDMKFNIKFVNLSILICSSIIHRLYVECATQTHGGEFHMNVMTFLVCDGLVTERVIHSYATLWFGVKTRCRKWVSVTQFHFLQLGFS